MRIYFILLLILSACGSFAGSPGTPQSISTSELSNFHSNPAKVQRLIEMGLELTKLNLNYKYASADPHNGGMDCSGTMYYLLNKIGIKEVPRSSNDLYNWVKAKGLFYKSDNELAHLHPGDLLFWTRTYAAPNNAYITHVMIYLGKNKDGQPLMMGSSDGRTYKGKQIYGVSIFDFFPPSSKSNNNFVGYSCIPGFSC